jgi:hypothetical protein
VSAREPGVPVAPVRRGGPVAVRRRRSVTTLRAGTEVREEWTLGIATSCSRAGLVKRWEDADGAQHRVEDSRDVFAILVELTVSPRDLLSALRDRLPVESAERVRALVGPYLKGKIR